MWGGGGGGGVKSKAYSLAFSLLLARYNFSNVEDAQQG